MTRPDDHLPARIIADNRVTIPEEFRERFDLDEGDRIWIHVEPIDGEKRQSEYSHAHAIDDLR